MTTWKLENEIWELNLASPPCNEIGTTMLESLEKFVAEVRERPGRAILIYSSLESGFCAGADLRELYQGLLSQPKGKHEPELRKFIDRVHGVLDTLDTLSVPVVGMIHGVCFGGGLELALVCDVLIAEKTARFCFPELRLGIVPGFGGIPRLKRELPNSVVRDLFLTGRSMNAQRAMDLGLVSQLVNAGEGLRVARMMTEQMKKFESTALRSAKAFIKPFPKDELKREKDLFIELALRPNVIEALKKFVESEDVRPYL